VLAFSSTILLPKFSASFKSLAGRQYDASSVDHEHPSPVYDQIFRHHERGPLAVQSGYDHQANAGFPLVALITILSLVSTPLLRTKYTVACWAKGLHRKEELHLVEPSIAASFGIALDAREPKGICLRLDWELLS
jgi:hypothetical protein